MVFSRDHNKATSLNFSCKRFEKNYGITIMGLQQIRDYNYGHNILRLFDVLPDFSFKISKAKHD